MRIPAKGCRAAFHVPGCAALFLMRMIRKRQCLMLESGTTGEVRVVMNRLFRLAA